MRWRRSMKMGLRLLRRLIGSDLSINASAVAYNAFLALVPIAFALLGVAAIIGRSDAAVERVETTLDPLVPVSVKEFVTRLLLDAGERVGRGSVWLIVGSVVAALLLGSRAVVALQKALATVEEATERRPPLQMRLVAMGLTAAGGAVLVLTSFLLVGGHRLIEVIAELIGSDTVLDLWVWLRVPISAVGLYLFLLALYRLGPPEPLPRSSLAALLATVGSVLGSLGFGVYLSASPGLGATFGVIGTVAVALVWLYVGAMAILFGAVVATFVDGGEANGTI